LEAIAPDVRRVRPFIWLVGGLAALGALMTLLSLSQGIHRISDASALAYGLTMLVVGGVGLAFLQLWVSKWRLLVGGNLVGYQDMLGRQHIWTTSEIGAVVKATIVYSRSGTFRPAVYVLGVDGRRLMALSVLAWDPSAIDRLVRASGRPLQDRVQPMSAAAFRREFPRALGWPATHPVLMGVGLALAVIALAIAIPIGWSYLR
jgi:hypothetical protein